MTSGLSSVLLAPCGRATTAWPHAHLLPSAPIPSTALHAAPNHCGVGIAAVDKTYPHRRHPRLPRTAAWSGRLAPLPGPPPPGPGSGATRLSAGAPAIGLRRGVGCPRQTPGAAGSRWTPGSWPGRTGCPLAEAASRSTRRCTRGGQHASPIDDTRTCRTREWTLLTVHRDFERSSALTSRRIECTGPDGRSSPRAGRMLSGSTLPAGWVQGGGASSPCDDLPKGDTLQ
jgi:hypothetical protein